jgi:transcriptional regulator with XRE-family HTH domain
MNDYEKAVNEIIERIKAARKEQKVSQKAVADLLGITQGAYSDMEKGKINFSAARLFQVCDMLGIDIINTKQGQNQLISVDSNKLIEIIAKQGKDIEEIKELLKKGGKH